MEEKLERIRDIYAAFETDVASYKTDAACKKGCAFCCTHPGSIDITTLEGLAIRTEIMRLPRSLQMKLRKDLKRDMQKREAGRLNSCPFLMQNLACRIYAQRPFACRRSPPCNEPTGSISWWTAGPCSGKTSSGASASSCWPYSP